MSKQVAPIKVDAATKERIRLAAAFLGIEQGEFVRRVVAAYLEANAKPLKERVAEARAALLEGDEAVLRYLRGESNLQSDSEDGGPGV